MVESVEIRSTAPLRRDLLDRGAHRQTEILDVVIAFVVNVVSAAAYDAVRERIRKRAEARQLRVVNLASMDHAPSALGTQLPKIFTTKVTMNPQNRDSRHDPCISPTSS